jgi:hypothetical protein
MTRTPKWLLRVSEISLLLMYCIKLTFNSEVMAAARNLGLAEKYTKEVQNWDGEEFSEVEFTDEDLKAETRKPKAKKKKDEKKPTKNQASNLEDQSSNPEGQASNLGGQSSNPKGQASNPEDQSKQPNNAIQEIYKLVEPFLELLFKDDADLNGLAALGAMNEKIKAQNQKDGVNPVDRFTIEISDLTRRFSEAKPLYIRFLENELDKEAEMGLINMRADMAKSYPATFIFKIPTPQSRQEVKQKEEEKRREEEAKNKEEKRKKEEAKKEEEKRKEEEAKRRAEEQAKGGITSTAPGKLKYPWTTHVLPDNRVIIAGRQHSIRGKIGKESTLIVASDQGEDPTFILTTGSAIGLEEAAVYFGLPNIKRLAEKKSDGGKAKTWTWRDKERFQRLLWVAVGTKKNHTFGKGSTSAHAQCCSLWDGEIDLCTRSEMNDAIEERYAKLWIIAYCERKGIVAPWDIEAENEIVPKGKKALAAQAWLAEPGLGNFATPPRAGYSTSGWTAVNSPPGNSQIKSLQDQMANLERKFSNFQPSTTGSLDSILAKLEERMGSMEKKLQVVESAGTQLAGYLKALSDKFDNLEQQVQL